jgi:hypothetical protein
MTGMLRGWLAWSVVVSVVTACDSPMSPTLPSDRVGRWQLDIDSFARQLTELHPDPFARIPRSRFESEIASLRAEVPSISDAAVVVGLMRILALVGDSHTTIDLRSFTGFRQLPLRFEWFADGIFVIGATEEYREALGLRLSRVGGAPIEAAIEALSEVIPYENESWLRFSLVSIMTLPEVLEAQHLVADASRIPLELVDLDGRALEFEIPAMPRQALTFVDAGPPPESRPLYRQRPEENYWLAFLEPSRTLYVQYRRASDGGPEPFSRFAARIVERLDAEPVRALVVDLRNNTGGNSGLMEPLLAALERRPQWSSGEGLYTIIGRATFSSALMNAFDLKARARSILVGEPTGGKPNHYGQVSSFYLPTSGIRVFHSTRFFRLSAVDPASLEPDVRVEIRSRDYFEGRDPVLETVLGFVGGG